MSAKNSKNVSKTITVTQTNQLRLRTMKIIPFIFCSLMLLFHQPNQAFGQQVEVVKIDQLVEKISRDTDSLYIINFWATWCLPCIKEMPYFQQASEAYADQKVRFIFVSLDFPDKLDAVNAFVAKKGLKEEVLLLDETNANEWIPRIDDQWSGAIPATLAVMSSQDIHVFKESSFTSEELTEWLDQILSSIKTP